MTPEQTSHEPDDRATPAPYHLGSPHPPAAPPARLLRAVALTYGTLLLVPLVLFQLLLGYGRNLHRSIEVLVQLLTSTYGFAPLAVALLVLSALHHSVLPEHRKLGYGTWVALGLLAFRAFLLARSDGWGVLGMMIIGGVEMTALCVAGSLLWVFNRTPGKWQVSLRLALFLLLLGLLLLQFLGLLRPGLLE